MQIKVKDTRMHRLHLGNNANGEEVSFEIPVVEAKLVLVKCKDIIPMSNQLAKNKITGSLFIVTVNNKNDGYLVKPILISETEKIEVGDWCWLSTHGGFIITQCQPHSVITDQKGISDVWHKILALPEHFSSKHLQAIVDGKMKDGDKVLVECQEEKGLGMYNMEDGMYIKLNSSNHITLHKVEEKMYTREQVREICYQLAMRITSDDVATTRSRMIEWFEQNVK